MNVLYAYPKSKSGFWSRPLTTCLPALLVLSLEVACHVRVTRNKATLAPQLATITETWVAS